MQPNEDVPMMAKGYFPAMYSQDYCAKTGEAFRYTSLKQEIAPSLLCSAVLETPA